jgi:hypothetical protein
LRVEGACGARKIREGKTEDGGREPHATGAKAAVAVITEGDPGALSEKLPTAPLVSRDSATRWAGRLGVESEVGELSPDPRAVRNREAAPAFISWHVLCIGWRVQAYKFNSIFRKRHVRLSITHNFRLQWRNPIGCR